MRLTFREIDRQNYNKYTVKFINSSRMYGVFYKGICQVSLFKTRELAQGWIEQLDNQ